MLYEYQCKCKKITEAHRLVHDMYNCPPCRYCGGRTKKLPFTSVPPCANTGRGGRIPGICTTVYDKPVYIKSKYHWREICRKEGMYPYGLVGGK